MRAPHEIMQDFLGETDSDRSDTCAAMADRFCGDPQAAIWAAASALFSIAATLADRTTDADAIEGAANKIAGAIHGIGRT